MIFGFLFDIFKVSKILDQYKNCKDQWLCQHCPLGSRIFGRGSKRPFSWYLEGVSNKIESFEELLNTLEKFRYKTDRALFGKMDLWQHPSEFEKRCEGDCEDHSLWAWRKLKEINMPTQFIVGCVPNKESKLVGHAWVTFERNKEKYLLEASWKNKNAMVMPIESEYVRNHYFPLLGVDSALRTYVYAGMGVIVNNYGLNELKSVIRNR